MRTKALVALAALLIPPAHANDHRVEEDALLMYVRPTASYVLLHCADTGDCEAKLVCYDRDGEPLELESVTVRSRRNHQVSMYKALVAAGTTDAEAQRSTTCEVRSEQELHVRAYSRLGGALVPVHGPLAQQDLEDPLPEPPPPGQAPPFEWGEDTSAGCGNAGCGVRLVWFWDPRDYTRVSLYRGTTRNFGAAAQILHGGLQDIPHSRILDWRYLVVYDDNNKRRDQTYYYWLVGETELGVRSNPVGPLAVRVPRS